MWAAIIALGALCAILLILLLLSMVWTGRLLRALQAEKQRYAADTETLKGMVMKAKAPVTFHASDAQLMMMATAIGGIIADSKLDKGQVM